ncbi:hypothetical protein [Streptomyces indicus]|uniref:Uncharacterized protein n=1 Tax=Streptomyces indicus TaxID=417292 RepID=A0A1G9H9H2_9ACTN|nr:hypothetical protein [Streptomyces indicus]SDL09569.1 hypothetical protein SAMN05421806_11865 [Streptomyces indicus]
MAHGGSGGPEPGIGGRFKRFQTRFQAPLTRAILAVIFVTGLVAQFVAPVGDALEGHAFLGGALLSLVAYVLYDAIQELVASARTPARSLVSSRDLSGLVSEAFRARDVDICFVGYTGETLYNELYHRLERLLDDPGPTRRVSVRMLIPDFCREMSVPARVGPDESPVDDPEFRRRLELKCQDYDMTLSGLAEQLSVRGRVEVTCTYRVYHGEPTEKICLFNKELVLHGLYDVDARMQMSNSGRVVYDPKGYNTDLYVWSARDGTATEVRAVAQWVRHFEGRWKLADAPSWRR